jgi:hypothetical protein
MFFSLKQTSMKPDDDHDKEKEKKRVSGERDLEMNHSHYLMLDDGTRRVYDTKDYRTRLCIQLGKLQNDDDVSGKYLTIS